MRVLVVEDDASVASGILDGLAHATLDAVHVSSGAAALEAVAAFAPDIVLLDLGLPDMDGTDVCRIIRTTSSVPIIVVSARDDEIDRVLALEMGADDYVVKPFGMRELVARIRAVSRRSVPVAPSVSGATETATNADAETPTPSVAAATRRFGSLFIDIRSQRVTVGDEPLHLTAKEFELLAYLSADPGAVFRRADILHDVWDTNWYGTTKTLDTHIAAIRKKLGNPAWIESVRGVGFRFSEPQPPVTQ
jgi:DNA-binding response OmpR family regulator